MISNEQARKWRELIDKENGSVAKSMEHRSIPAVAHRSVEDWKVALGMRAPSSSVQKTTHHHAAAGFSRAEIDAVMTGRPGAAMTRSADDRAKCRRIVENAIRL